jgi:hypothetical protein
MPMQAADDIDHLVRVVSAQQTLRQLLALLDVEVRFAEDGELSLRRASKTSVEGVTVQLVTHCPAVRQWHAAMENADVLAAAIRKLLQQAAP